MSGLWFCHVISLLHQVIFPFLWAQGQRGCLGILKADWFFLFVFFPPQRRENPIEVSRIKCTLEGKCGDVEELLGVWERELALPVRLLRSSAPTVGFGGVRDVWELGRSRQESGGAGWEVQP